MDFDVENFWTWKNVEKNTSKWIKSSENVQDKKKSLWKEKVDFKLCLKSYGIQKISKWKKKKNLDSSEI